MQKMIKAIQSVNERNIARFLFYLIVVLYIVAVGLFVIAPTAISSMGLSRYLIENQEMLKANKKMIEANQEMLKANKKMIEELSKTDGGK